MDKKQLTTLVIRIDRLDRVEGNGDRECFAQVQAAPAMSFVRHPHAGLLAMPSGRRLGRDRGEALRAGRLAGSGSATRRRLAINASRTVQSGWSRLLLAGAAALEQRTPARKQEAATAEPYSPCSVELADGHAVATRGA
jgi:pyruvate/2-oxoglutarate dehydrogenase complex dihydrolipoamide acyltransferase (E2) component